MVDCDSEPHCFTLALLQEAVAQSLPDNPEALLHAAQAAETHPDPNVRRRLGALSLVEGRPLTPMWPIARPTTPVCAS